MYVRFGKRVCDIVVGLVALPFVLLIIAVLAPFIHFEDKGPVFYNAPRVGKDGRDFKMYKLRSMRVNAPDLIMEDGSTYNGADDPRMTRVGAFMRKTSLDEMPQFLNVLKGDMSVGPARLAPRNGAFMRERRPQTHVFGIGTPPHGRNSLPWHDRLALDVHYVRNVSFPLDVKVSFKTFGRIQPRGGSQRTGRRSNVRLT